MNYKELYPTGTLVYTSVVHTSMSGMTRHVAVYVAQGGEIHNISRIVAEIVGWKWSDKYGKSVIVKGCGMDMGFHLVYTFSSLLHGDGYALKHRSL